MRQLLVHREQNQSSAEANHEIKPANVASHRCQTIIETRNMSSEMCRSIKGISVTEVNESFSWNVMRVKIGLERRKALSNKSSAVKLLEIKPLPFELISDDVGAGSYNAVRTKFSITKFPTSKMGSPIIGRKRERDGCVCVCLHYSIKMVGNCSSNVGSTCCSAASSPTQCRSKSSSGANQRIASDKQCTKTWLFLWRKKRNILSTFKQNNVWPCRWNWISRTRIGCTQSTFSCSLCKQHSL